MISERSKALLQAAATIYAQAAMSHDLPHMTTPELRDACVDTAYALLALIEAREKANAPKSIPLPPCRCVDVPGDHPGCRIHGDES